MEGDGTRHRGQVAVALFMLSFLVSGGASFAFSVYLFFRSTPLIIVSLGIGVGVTLFGLFFLVHLAYLKQSGGVDVSGLKCLMLFSVISFLCVALFFLSFVLLIYINNYWGARERLGFTEWASSFVCGVFSPVMLSISILRDYMHLSFRVK
ncbi:hypothetical protein [Streptomonospora halophila]|uniref:hypothetical protein n=1 Tax=Streptomonospora halophila TaxID=427369 RepID=UPI0031EA5BE0